MNKKGQALVEFVLLIPIILMVLFVVIDFASIFYDRNHLEGILNDVVLMAQENVSEIEIKKAINDPSITYSLEKNGQFAVVKLKKEVNMITPFSNVFFESPYVIKTERTIFYE